MVRKSGQMGVPVIDVNGKIIMEARSFRWDTAAAYVEAQKAARALWQKMDQL